MKSPIAYHLLHVLAAAEGESPQAKFMRLSVAERRQLLSQQAEQMKDHYEQTEAERAEWQAGYICDLHSDLQSLRAVFTKSAVAFKR